MEYCVQEHPWLCVVVGDQDTDKAFYERVSAIDLKDHVSIVQVDEEDTKSSIKGVLASELDKPFTAGIPPWRIVVLPLGSSQCFIAYSFSHTIGDGPSGASFHKSFLKACQSLPSNPSSSLVETSRKPLPDPFDTPKRLPISWSFLLTPLIAHVTPNFAAKLFGLRVSASAVDEGTWTATPIFYDPATFRSKVEIQEIESSLLDNAIKVSRKHDAKLTGLLQQFVARALSKVVTDASVTNFVTQTAINMRRSVGTPSDEMGEFASGCYVAHPRANSHGPMSEHDWQAAREATRKFAESATTLQDQAIGLLRYVPSIRKWTVGKIGQKRDCSIEMSNVGVLDTGDEGPAKILSAVFAQPGHVTGPPISFNFVSVKGGNLVYTVTWQAGALGVPEEHEDGLVEKLCSSLKHDFERLE